MCTPDQTNTTRRTSRRRKIARFVCALLAAGSSFCTLTAATLRTDIPGNPDDMQVFFNGVDASPFLTLKHNLLSFQIPFPQDSSPFNLRIVERASGNLLLGGDYQITPDGVQKLTTEDDPSPDGAADSEISVDDNVGEQSPQSNFQSTAQLDVSGLASDTRGSDYPRAETLQDGESDFLSSINASWERPRLAVNTELEAVHRSNPDNTLRPNGPRADLSRMTSTLEVRGPLGASFNLLAGDVSTDSPNTLVNTGFASRGLVLGFTSPNERFSWSVGRLYGHDIVGTIRGPLALGNESYRIATNYNFKIVNKDAFSWDLSFVNLRAKRATEDHFSIGSTNSGERNNVWGTKSEFGLLDGRVNLIFSFAHSTYDNPDELNADNIPTEEEFEVYDPGQTDGNAYRHSITWNAYTDYSSNKLLKFEYGTERADPFYRSIHGQSTADRRQWSFFTTFSTGRVSGQLGTTQYQNNLDNLISIHTLDEGVHRAEISFDLTSSQNDGNDTSTNRAHPLLPANIGFNTSIEDLKTLNGEVIILAPVIEGFDFMNQTTETYGISASWDNGAHSTSVDMSYSFLDIDQRERASADRRDVNYGISHSYNRDNWNISANASITNSDDLDIASRSTNESIQWGLSGSYITEGGVSWSAAFDSGATAFDYLVSEESEESDSKSFSLSVDYGAWLASKLSLGVDPTMTLRWHRSESDNKSTFYSSDQVSESISFNLGVSF